MKRFACLLAVLGVLGVARDGRAEIGTIDAVPAATLLLPYFEVDLANANGINTFFSINNASASAAVANVVIWTDWGVPSLGFQVYLTGYDVQTVSLRDVFNGTLPLTGDDAADFPDTLSPTDGISNQGAASQDINFPGSVGPCGSRETLYDRFDPTLGIKIQNLQRVHQGLSSPLDGQCWGASHGDSIARGYVTIDSVTQCSLLTPANVGYASGVLDYRNILWGDYLYVDPGQNFAQGETLVHVEACVPGNGFAGYVGNGAGFCPLGAGDYSFYGRYVAATAIDQREPLPTTFAAPYSGSVRTDLLVWRDTKTTPSGINGPRPCGLGPAWFPMSQTDVVGFDQRENVADLCFLPDNVSPPIGGAQTCFPLATQRVNVRRANALAEPTGIPFNAGWLFLNLNHTIAGDPFPGVSQAWVSVVQSEGGRFSSGQNGIALDNALTTAPGGVIFIP